MPRYLSIGMISLGSPFHPTEEAKGTFLCMCGGDPYRSPLCLLCFICYIFIQIHHPSFLVCCQRLLPLILARAALACFLQMRPRMIYCLLPDAPRFELSLRLPMLGRCICPDPEADADYAAI